MVSGSISLPSPGFFSPFPHGTTSLSVAVTYLALESGLPSFRQGFSCPAVLRFRSHVAGCISHTGLSPSLVALPRKRSAMHPVFDYAGKSALPPERSYNPTHATLHRLHACGLGSSPFARRYSGNHGCCLFLQVLRWFSSLGFASYSYVFTAR